MRHSKPECDEIDISSSAFWSLDAAQRADSFSVLRRERPVSWHPPFADNPGLGDEGCWALVRHRDIVEACRRPDVLLCEDPTIGIGDATRALVALDPARGSRSGRLLGSVFTPKRVERLEQQIRNRAKRVVDALTPLGEVDFVEAVSSRMGAGTVADMFGVPEDLRNEVMAGGLEALQQLARSVVEAHRSDPQDDVMSALIAAEIEGLRLTDEEIAAVFVRTWIAQTELTRQTASHAIKALSDFPDQRQLLMSDFESRIYPAIEEFLRWASPVMTSRRRAAVDVEMGGQAIGAGDVVILVYASGNRDDDVFADADRFSVTRSPNHHLALGGGAAGLGHHLIRTQLQALFTELLYRLPDLRIGPAEHGTGSVLGSIERMPATFTPVGVAVPAPRGQQSPKVGRPR